MAHPSVDVYVDTTDTIDKKIAALRCHVSQIPDPDGPGPAHARLGRDDREPASASPRAALAEAFQSVDAA